tara:strand:- start:15695 stop:17653 length:1959 start_codon:yes stop_codon:yes gene_type:complete
MGTKRYVADADNTIVNTYYSNLTKRATGSNAGEADILEVYSIWARQEISASTSTGSQELSRILIKFPTSTMSSDRTAGKIPASGSVSWYLRMYSAGTTKTVPKDYKLFVQPVTNQWEEGDGLDLENYRDKTNNGTGSNWINANGNSQNATATLTALSKTAGQANTRTLVITDVAGNSVTFTIDNSLSTSTATKIAFGNANSNASQFATNIAAAVNAANDAGSLNVSASASSATVTLTQTAAGLGGNKNSSLNVTGTGIDDSVVTMASSGGYHYSGGDGPWKNVGGDYADSPSYVQSFSTGLEDVEVDITSLVEDWIAGTVTNYGVGVRLSASYEAYFSHSTGKNSGSVIHNPSGSKKSYYTKRFFGRGSQYFFKRPCLEARWNTDVKRDDRGNFYFSSSLAGPDDNLNTLYLYNYVRGSLRDIPNIGKEYIFVSLYSGSSNDTAPDGDRLVMYNNDTVMTGGWISTGIYTCSVALTKSATVTLDTVYDVWHDDGTARGSGSVTQYFTGSVKPIVMSAGDNRREPTYYINVTNLQNSYMRDQIARFNVYIREKNWNPSIYSKATATPQIVAIQSASYRVFRTLDGYEALSHGTGSDLNTILSYDVSGNYFDLDMSLLEPGYEYGLKLSFYDSGLSSWQEQNEIFKFRVEDYEY